MANPRSEPFPAAAVEWLAPASPSSLLAIGQGSVATASRLARLGHRISLVDKSVEAVWAAARRHPDFRCLAASADALPLVPYAFDVVLVAQGMHLLAPGLALAEFARVLAPDGTLAVLHTVRDDSVPWVRRLAALLQAHDPTVMATPEVATAEALAASRYFTDVRQRSFRMWVPITRDGMLDMVSRVPALAQLPEPEASGLLQDVGALYDSSARRPEPLLLPYSVLCWQARVDHSEFTSQFRLPGDGLQIHL